MTLEERASKVLFEAEKAGAYQGIMNCVAAHLYSYRAQAQPGAENSGAGAGWRFPA